MNATRFHSTESNNEEQSKSNSTIQLEFNESVVQMLATTHDMNRNSCASLHRYSSRKRCTSRESPSTTSHEDEDSIHKKQRTFSPILRSQHIVSLSETDETQSQKGRIVSSNFCMNRDDLCFPERICRRSVSMQNVCDHRLDWLKDFMRQSLDTIRETVVEACLTAISARSIMPFHSNITTHDVNVNNHLLRLVRSEHSLTSRKTKESRQYHRLDDTAENSSKVHRIHYRARTNPYSMHQNVLRIPVSDNRVPWSYDWPQYRPTTFTAEEIYVNPGADPGIDVMSHEMRWHFSSFFFRPTQILTAGFPSFQCNRWRYRSSKCLSSISCT